MADLFSKGGSPIFGGKNTGGWTVNAAGGAYIDDWVTIGVNGGIFQGTGTPASPTTGLKIYNSSAVGIVEMWKAGVKTFYFDTNGDVFLSGSITATAGSIGGWTIGTGLLSAGTGADAVGMAPGTYPFYAGHATPASAPFSVSKAGALVATSATITGAITANSGSFAGVMTIGASGGIYQGTGTFASPTTGLKIWNDSGVGRLATYNTGVAQVYFGTDGKLYAGAGIVRLDSDGLSIVTNGDTLQSAITWYETTTEIGRVTLHNVGGASLMRVTTTRASGLSQITVKATGESGDAYIVIEGAAEPGAPLVTLTGGNSWLTITEGYSITANSVFETDEYFKSTHATGQAPIVVTSTTLCTNLNADTVDGYHAAASLVTNAILKYDGTDIDESMLSDDGNTVVINQGASDAPILAFSSSDVAHGITTWVATDCYGYVVKVVATEGGLLLRGFSSGQYGLYLDSVVTTENSTKSTSGGAAITLRSYLKSGTSVAAMSADANIVRIVNNGSGTVWIADTDGDTWQNGSITAVGGFGCNSKAAQAAYALNAAIAGTADGTYNATEQGLINSLVSQVNKLRAALVANGICS